MKKPSMVFIVMIFILMTCLPARSHFGMLIPTDTMVMQSDSRTVTVTLSFSHPFEMAGMEMVKPQAFHVLAGGKQQDLLGSLKKTQVMGHSAWKTTYPVGRPGVYMWFKVLSLSVYLRPYTLYRMITPPYSLPRYGRRTGE